MRDRIEAVTVCVGYGDFLEHTLPANIDRFDRILVCTNESDEHTREVCRKHDVDCLLSNDHTRDGGGFGGGTFNKGRMVERGLQHLSEGNWRVHIDADVIMPTQFRRLVEGAHLNTRKIYGCDRVMVKSWEDWQRLKDSGYLLHKHCNVHMPPDGFQLGTRWARHDTGHVPIGFFQMWHSAADEWRGTRIRKYPINHGAAHRTDVKFAQLWDSQDREILGEIICVHLESEPCKLGANWNGRKTKWFGPSKDGPSSGKGCS